jgi:hypothetical protein
MKGYSDNDDADDFDDDDDITKGSGPEEPYKDPDYDLMKIDQDHRLLLQATTIASKDWFWIFRTHRTKIERIEDVYSRLVSLLKQTGE